MQRKAAEKAAFLSYKPKKVALPLLLLAGGRGFEPLHTDPESVVLPLDEPPLTPQVYHIQNSLYRASI